MLTDEPVGFHPDNKTVNVVHVDALADAIRFANVATKTVGVYPCHRKAELRDGLASMGAQRLVRIAIALDQPHLRQIKAATPLLLH